MDAIMWYIMFIRLDVLCHFVNVICLIIALIIFCTACCSCSSPQRWRVRCCRLSFKLVFQFPYYFVAVCCVLACYMHAPIQDVQVAGLFTSPRPAACFYSRFVATEATMSLFTVKWWMAEIPNNDGLVSDWEGLLSSRPGRRSCCHAGQWPVIVVHHVQVVWHGVAVIVTSLPFAGRCDFPGAAVTWGRTITIAITKGECYWRMLHFPF